MQINKLITIISFLLLANTISKAQQATTYTDAEIDVHSYQLYLNGSWDELLEYGKTAIEAKHDFILLRLRMGYAAVMKQNYCEALKHYDNILKKDKYNEIARYYTWYCRQYLNQTEFSVLNANYFSKEILKKEKIKKYALTSAGIESSYKMTDLTIRNNAFYNRIKLNARLGWKLNMSQSFVSFNQNINEPALTSVTDNNSININQKEYYNLLTYNLDQHWQIKGAYHFLYTPFNNFIYNNHIGMIGAKYHGNYINIQADAIAGTLIDTAVQQYDLHLEYYPTGNLNLYGSSTLSLQERNNLHAFNFKQVLGFKVYNKIWFEGNATLGNFSNRFENDALYVYNAIDKNIFKLGATIYYFPNKNLQLQVGILSEKRMIYNTNYIFNQNSINGGLTWKF